MHAPGHAATWDVDSAMRTLRALAAAEANPALVALQAAAKAHGLPCLPDDDEVSIGAGTGGQAWPADALPDPATIRSEEHTSELQSPIPISYAVFCLTKSN